MKITVNTKTKTINEKFHKSDSKLSTSEIETVLSNQIAILIASQAHKNYKKENVQLAYVDLIAETAKKFVRKLEQGITPEERLLRNIFGEDTLNDDKEYGEE